MLQSEAQYKLTALLTKTKELVPFATDAACDKLFSTLAQFARDMLKENERRKEHNYDEMLLEELLGLDKPPGLSPFCVISHFFLLSPSPPPEPKSTKRGQDDGGKGESVVDDGSERRKTKEAEAHPPKKRQAVAAAAPGAAVAVPWDIEKHPNVTDVTVIVSEPFRMEFLARPAGQGKHTPIACFATEAKLLDLDLLPKAEKVDQQKRRRIVEKLTKALLCFAATNDLPSTLKSCLSKTEWGAEILTTLVFDSID
jgi:hypothetical protein